MLPIIPLPQMAQLVKTAPAEFMQPSAALLVSPASITVAVAEATPCHWVLSAAGAPIAEAGLFRAP